MNTWTKEETQEFARLMDVWNETRAAWLARFGNDTGFSEWFKGQIIN